MINSLIDIPVKRIDIIKIKLNEDFDDNIQKIYEEQVSKLEKRFKEKLSEENKLSILKKSKTLLDYHYRTYHKENIISIYDDNEILISKIIEKDGKIILVKNNGIQIETNTTLDKLNKYINHQILEDYETGVFYCTQGHLQKIRRDKRNDRNKSNKV